MRPPRLRCVLFLLIYSPHLLIVFSATFGLHLLLQTYPYIQALYVISIRRTESLLSTSFRFHLTMDTLVVQLCASSLPRCTRDFHPLESAHGGQTKRRCNFLHLLKNIFYFPICFATSSAKFSSLFSSPSPFSNLANLTISAPFDSTSFPTFISGSLTKSCSTKQISP